jgi:hypothetical protein
VLPRSRHLPAVGQRAQARKRLRVCEEEES